VNALTWFDAFFIVSFAIEEHILSIQAPGELLSITDKGGKNRRGSPVSVTTLYSGFGIGIETGVGKEYTLRDKVRVRLGLGNPNHTNPNPKRSDDL
jgi:hypothetical protein